MVTAAFIGTTIGKIFSTALKREVAQLCSIIRLGNSLLDCSIAKSSCSFFFFLIEVIEGEGEIAAKGFRYGGTLWLGVKDSSKYTSIYSS